jgi:aarF domain-containing kinase
MQRAAGVASFGDITQLLSSAPRDIVELLRITAVVRNVDAALGCSLADRIRINATWAFRGLSAFQRGSAGGADSSEVDKQFDSFTYRLNIQARLALIRGYLAVNAVVNRVLLATLAVFGQPVMLY